MKYLDLCEKIGFSSDWLTVLKDMNEKYGADDAFKSFASQKATFKMPDKIKNLELLYGITLLACDYYEKYFCIPEAIRLNTLKDIVIWAENFYIDYDMYGVANSGWLLLHLNGKLFRVGRLQYEFSKQAQADGVFNEGDALLSIHIPQGEPLDPQACLDSISSAKLFFAEYYPDFKFKGFNCSSWLLSPLLKNVLQENSNILAFQKLFVIYEENDDGWQAKERIFGRKFESLELKDYPQKTSLQKAAFEYLQNGGKLGHGSGYILNE